MITPPLFLLVKRDDLLHVKRKRVECQCLGLQHVCVSFVRSRKIITILSYDMQRVGQKDKMDSSEIDSTVKLKSRAA